MDRVLEPVSSAWLAGLAVVVAAGAAGAVAGLALSDPGEDAERISYLVSLLAAAATAVLLVVLSQRRRVQIARLRTEAAVVVFHLRTRGAELAQATRLSPEDLAETLRAATRLAIKARALTEALTRAGVEQEAIELRVAVEAIEFALRAGGAASA